MTPFGPLRPSRATRAIAATLATGLCAAALAATTITTSPANAAQASGDSIVANFQSPDLDAKPMARMWFPDAGAGADAEGLALVAKQINDLAAGGFGGVEVSFLSDTTNYTNEQAATVGFGSPDWKNIVRQLLETANAVEGGFKVDFTITSHWPPVVNTIDPNDDAQQKEASQAWTKITAADLTAGSMDLPLPPTKTQDFSNVAALRAPFVFTDTYSSAAVAKVAAITNGQPVLALASLRDVSGATSKKRVSAQEAAAGAPYFEADAVRYAGSPAGVPDQAYATEHGLDYEKDVVAKFGPEPANADFDGKIDADGNRKRMADWQYNYQADLDGVATLGDYTPSAGDDLAVGDYVLIGNYYRGTGQIMSGGTSVTQHNRTYATDYFTDLGVQAIFQFWDDNILDDEIRGLLEANGQHGTSIFEDSIEIHNDGPLWTHDLPAEYKDFFGRNLGAAASVLATESTTLFDDTEAVTRIREDYNLVLGDLYDDEHASLISDWTETFGYTYRAQAYTLAGLDIAEAGASVDIPEGDNSTAGDGLRNLAAAVNLTGKKMLSMESVTFTADINSPWSTVLKELNSDFADGVNRSILHGTAFATSFNGYESAWPGWNFKCCGNRSFTSWNARQVWWDSVDDFSNYVSRNQAVMQGGHAQVDLAVLIGSDTGYSIQSGNSLQQLLNRGYNYNLVSQPLLEQDSAVVEDGVLAPDGPAYQAMVVKNARRLSVATVEKLISYAQAGLPIVVLDSDIERVYGTSTGSNTDAALAAAVTKLLAQDTVTSAPTQKEVRALLTAAGVEPAAGHSITGLETAHRADESGEYYYLYNADTAAPVSGKVTLHGAGTPYILNATTGDITPIGSYTRDGDEVIVDVSLASRTSEIIGLITDTAGLDKAPAVHATGTSGGTVVVEDGELALRTTQAGTYTVALSDGATREVTVNGPAAAVELSTGWDLAIESWGPDAAANASDPTASAKTNVNFTDVALGGWGSLAATSAQLTSLGVDSMAKVSGIGTYSRAIELPDTWTASDGYVLTLNHGTGDNITGVVVNGATIESVNQFTNTVDIGHLLRPGSNTLEITIETSLGHRTGAAASQTYGLTGIGTTSYTDTTLAEEEPEPTTDPEPTTTPTPTPSPTTTPTPAPVTDVVNTKRPSIGGKAVVGRKLTARPGQWTPASAKLTYRWLRDGKAIRGATSKSLKVSKKDAGHRLSVRVTATADGYTSATATSKTVKVAATKNKGKRS